MRLRAGLGMVVALAMAPAAEARVWYVDGSVHFAGDGSSWERAFKYLQSALRHHELAEGDQIWVAAGAYFCDQYALSPQGTDDPAASFELVAGVELYGGFPPGGGSGTFAARNPTHYQTRLRGDLLDVPDEPMEACGDAQAGAADCYTSTPGVAGCLDYSCCGVICDSVPYCCAVEWDALCSDAAFEVCTNSKARHVVTARGIGSEVTIDGFVISGGSAFDTTYGYGGGGMLVGYDGDVLVANCTFVDNTGEIGGAMYFDRPASVVNCRFLHNRAAQGGAVYIGGPAAVADFVNCLFVGNISEDGPGGAIYLTEPATVRMANCTLLDNFGTQHGRALYKVPRIANSIVWGSGLSPVSGAESVTFSCVQGGHEGAGNISEFPLFLDPINDDYRLAAGSPCIDASLIDDIPKDFTDLDGDRDRQETTPLDLNLRPRFIGVRPDMGAYEFCRYDLDHDGVVRIEDLLLLLGAWGSDPGGPPDFDGDGDVGITDLQEMMGNWSTCG